MTFLSIFTLIFGLLFIYFKFAIDFAKTENQDDVPLNKFTYYIPHWFTLFFYKHLLAFKDNSNFEVVKFNNEKVYVFRNQNFWFRLNTNLCNEINKFKTVVGKDNKFADFYFNICDIQLFYKNLDVTRLIPNGLYDYIPTLIWYLVFIKILMPELQNCLDKRIIVDGVSI
jgi:hypothetical protein